MSRGPLAPWSTVAYGIREAARELGADTAVVTAVAGEDADAGPVFALLLREFP